MGRRKGNQEDKLEGLMLNVKGYIRDNINDDPNAISEIYAFIESKWGKKDIERYEEQRKVERIGWLKRNLEDESSRLSELETKYGVKSDIYKMMQPGIIKKITKYENELGLIKD